MRTLARRTSRAHAPPVLAHVDFVAVAADTFPDMRAENAFDFLVAPISTATFFEHYFERDVLHVARADPGYFAELYSVRCLEDALDVGAIQAESFQLIKVGTPTPQSISRERRSIRSRMHQKASRSVLDPRDVLTAFADGHTLSISDATAYHPALAGFCNRIQAQLDIYTQVNAYFTPARAQGFAVHYDTHDTLIVQIDGTKHWDVYDPILPLPLENQPFSQRMHAGRLGTPRAIRLETGDSLYIPRGFPHQARTGANRSLHLTFALAPIRVIDLLDSLLQLAAARDVELRRALPFGWQHDPDFPARLSARLTELMPRALAPEQVPHAIDAVHDDVFGATRTTASGVFDTLAAFETLAADSSIALRDDIPFELRERGDQLEIVLAAKSVRVPIAARTGFTRLAAGPATFAEIEATLSDRSGRDFVRMLVVEGLVHVAAAIPPVRPVVNASRKFTNLRTSAVTDEFPVTRATPPNAHPKHVP